VASSCRAMSLLLGSGSVESTGRRPNQAGVMAGVQDVGEALHH
jgi:hypothetical protein